MKKTKTKTKTTKTAERTESSEARLRRLAQMRYRRARREAAPRMKELAAAEIMALCEDHERRMIRRAARGKLEGWTEKSLRSAIEDQGEGLWVPMESVYARLRQKKRADGEELLRLARAAARHVAASRGLGVKISDADLAVRAAAALASGNDSKVSQLQHPRTLEVFDRYHPDGPGGLVAFFYETWEPTGVLSRLLRPEELDEDSERTAELAAAGVGTRDLLLGRLRALVVSVVTGPGSCAGAVRYLANRGLVDAEPGSWTRRYRVSSRTGGGGGAGSAWTTRWKSREIEGGFARVRLRRVWELDADGQRRWVTEELAKELRKIRSPHVAGRVKTAEEGERSLRRQAEKDAFVVPHQSVLHAELVDVAGKEGAELLERTGQDRLSAVKPKRGARKNSAARKERTLLAMLGHLKFRETSWRLEAEATGDGRPLGVWVDLRDVQEELAELAREELELRLVEGAVQNTVFGEERYYPVLLGSTQLQAVVRRGLAAGKLDACRRFWVPGTDGGEVPYKSALRYTHARLAVPAADRDASCSPPLLEWPAASGGKFSAKWGGTPAIVVVQHGAESEMPSKFLRGDEKRQALAREAAARAERELYRRKKMVPADQRHLVT